MRQPPSGSKFAVICETEEVSGDSPRLTGPAHANAVNPPAISPRNARRPYGRVSGGGVSGLGTARASLAGRPERRRNSTDRVKVAEQRPADDDARRFWP